MRYQIKTLKKIKNTYTPKEAYLNAILTPCTTQEVGSAHLSL